MILVDQNAAPKTRSDNRFNPLKPGSCWVALCILITSLAVSILITGCTPGKTPIKNMGTNEPNQAVITETPVLIEPPAVIEYEPNTVTIPSKPTPEPGNEPNIAEPNIAEPKNHKTDINEPNIIDSNAGKAGPKVTFHDKCADILRLVVDKNGMVAYRKLKLKRADLEGILDEFATLDRKVYETWPRNDKIAFWINAYNIQMLRIIADNYPIKTSKFALMFWPPTSIRHIDPTNKIGVSKWDKYKFLVMDEEFTLAGIEQDIFREKFKDPRVFLALTHATLSGPPLSDAPYYGETLQIQLDDQVKRFLANPKAFKIDRQKSTVYISAMFDPKMYGKDFIEKYGTEKKFKQQKTAIRAVLSFITNYVSPADVKFLERENYTVNPINYDWRVNDRYKKP